MLEKVWVMVKDFLGIIKNYHSQLYLFANKKAKKRP